MRVRFVELIHARQSGVDGAFEYAGELGSTPGAYHGDAVWLHL